MAKAKVEEEVKVEGKVPAMIEDKGVHKPADVYVMGEPALPKDFKAIDTKPASTVKDS